MRSRRSAADQPQKSNFSAPEYAIPRSAVFAKMNQSKVLTSSRTRSNCMIGAESYPCPDNLEDKHSCVERAPRVFSILLAAFCGDEEERLQASAACHSD